MGTVLVEYISIFVFSSVIVLFTIKNLSKVVSRILEVFCSCNLVFFDGPIFCIKYKDVATPEHT